MTRTPSWQSVRPSPEHPPLRLVNGDVAAPQRPVRTVTQAPATPGMSPETAKRRRMEVARENHAASTLDASDGRWIFAVLVSKTLEGGRAAVLSPQRRGLLMGNAKELGLREFDANLVIAIVQDCVRTGHERLCSKTEARLAMVRPAQPAMATKLWHLVTAGLLAGASLAAMIIYWFKS